MLSVVMEERFQGLFAIGGLVGGSSGHLHSSQVFFIKVGRLFSGGFGTDRGRLFSKMPSLDLSDNRGPLLTCSGQTAVDCIAGGGRQRRSPPFFSKSCEGSAVVLKKYGRELPS